MKRLLISFCLSVIVTTVLIIAVSTQNTFSGLRDLVGNVPLSKQLTTTLSDIASTGPLLFAIIAAGFLIALPSAHILFKAVKRYRSLIFFVAGMICVFVILFGMERAFFGTPLLQGAREPTWMILTMACGGIGAKLFAILTRNREKETA